MGLETIDSLCLALTLHALGTWCWLACFVSRSGLASSSWGQSQAQVAKSFRSSCLLGPWVVRTLLIWALTTSWWCVLTECPGQLSQAQARATAGRTVARNAFCMALPGRILFTDWLGYVVASLPFQENVSAQARSVCQVLVSGSLCTCRVSLCCRFFCFWSCCCLRFWLPPYTSFQVKWLRRGRRSISITWMAQHTGVYLSACRNESSFNIDISLATKSRLPDECLPWICPCKVALLGKRSQTTEQWGCSSLEPASDCYSDICVGIGSRETSGS